MRLLRKFFFGCNLTRDLKITTHELRAQREKDTSRCFKHVSFPLPRESADAEPAAKRAVKGKLHGLRLLETHSAVSLFPLAAFFENVNALESLQNVPLEADLTG
jgi:hypothetical protein